MDHKKQHAAERSLPLLGAGVADKPVSAGLLGSHGGRRRETVLRAFSRDTALTISLVHMNFQGKLFLRNVLRTQYLFLAPGHLSKSKEKREGRGNAVPRGQQGTASCLLSWQAHLPVKYQV